MFNVELKNNSAINGGAIFIHKNSSINFFSVRFANNEANIGGGKLFPLNYKFVAIYLLTNEYMTD